MLCSKSYSLLLYWVVLGLLFMQCTSADPDREANRLFVEAYQLAEKAAALEQEDPAEAYLHYRKALENLDLILREYSDTEVAVDVTQQQTRIGEMTIGDLRRQLPLFQSRAEAINRFENLSVYLASREENLVARARMLLRFAQWSYENETADVMERVLRQVRESADRHWNTQLTDSVYLKLTDMHARLHQWDAAKETADRIEHLGLFYSALEAILDHGYLHHAGVSGISEFEPLMTDLNSIQYLGLLQILCEDLFALGMAERAANLLDRRIPVPEPDQLLSHIEGLAGLSRLFAGQGYFEISRRLISEIEELNREYAAFARRDLASALARRQYIEEAMQIVEDFEQEYFKTTSLSAIAVEYARNGYITQSLSLLTDIPDKQFEKTEAMIEIAFILADYRDFQRSDSLIAAAALLSGELDAPLRKAEISLQLSELYRIRQQQSQSAELLEEAERQAFHISADPIHNRVLGDIFTGWLRIERPDRALDLATRFRMDDSSFHNQVSYLLGHALDHNYHDLSRSLAGITDQNAFYLHLLNRLYLYRGNLARSMELSYEIRSSLWRSRSLADLAAFLQHDGRTEDAEKVASDALQTILRIRDPGEIEETLEYVSSRLAAAGFTMNDERRTLTSHLLHQLNHPS